MANNCENNLSDSGLTEAQSGIASVCDTQCGNNSKAKSRAEYHREWRARKKGAVDCAPPDIPTGKKTKAQYQREYRARKKAEKLKQAEPSSAIVEQSAIANSSSSASTPTINLEMASNGKKRKSSVEKQRDYRERKRAKCGNNSETSETTVPATIVPSTTSLPFTNYGPSTSRIIIPNEPTRRKSAAEYQREYRERMKSRLNNISIHSTADSLTRNAGSSPTMMARTNEQLNENIEDTSRHDIPQDENIDDRRTDHDTHGDLQPPYSQFHQHENARNYVQKHFTENSFGFACMICDRLWFKQDLKQLPANTDQELLNRILPDVAAENIKLCTTCLKSIRAKKVPTYAIYNGFKYPSFPQNLPPLDIITERLISPRIPFMEIRRLRHINGQYRIFGQIINVPVDVDTMVKRLPRDISDDYCFNVHIKKRKIHKSSYMQGLINKRTVRVWLNMLNNTPLYQEITIDPAFLTEPATDGEMPNDDLSEQITMEDSLEAQQQTLLWDEDKYLRLAPGENNVPKSLLFDDYAEELSFPGIYLGQMRTFRDGLSVTAFQMATSEIRRSDRRGVTPRHLLYMAAKNMRLRVSSALTIAFKFIGRDSKVTKEQIQSEEYINKCLETNLAFLKSIPNSVYYWAQRKKDLFAMIRQLGRLTLFLTMSANEIGWIPLLQLLQEMNNGTVISEDEAAQLNWLQKSTLINEDAVTCVIYYDKLVHTLMNLLQSEKLCPFGRYRVKDFFKRIEFQHRGSPHAHILLWLEHAPENPLDQNKQETISLIDSLIAVSTSESSGNIKFQTHKHTFTCYKKVRANQPQKCRFEAPFLPSRSTQILVPMKKEEPDFTAYSDHYKKIKSQYEITDYDSIDQFYESNNIASDEHYHKILRAGINRPRVFLKRQPNEKWHNPFNPFLFNILGSNMDIQFILDEYSCAMYVVDYVNKSNRGISNLQQKILEITEEFPDFDVVEVTRKMSVDLLNSVEMSSQEAAWWLLRKSMSEGSSSVVFIPTSWPADRQRLKKAEKALAELDEESTDIWKGNIFDKYEERPQELNDVTLAQFSAQYTCHADGKCKKLKKAKIIRYTNYNMTTQFNEHKREMVTLHIPFRSEELEILSESKFLQIFSENQEIILQRRKEFESNIDIEETLRLCRPLYREDEILEQQGNQQVPGVIPEPLPFGDMYADPNSEINDDLRLATLSRLQSIAKRRENLMPNAEFCELMRKTNVLQRSILLEIIHRLTSQQSQPLRVFLTGPAGCGKTFVIRLILEIYNKYATTNAHCNAYLTCASTGKAAVAINGTTVHTALSLSTGVDNGLSAETLHQFRSLFQHIRVVIIDEISMIGAELLERIDRRLRLITGKSDVPFGGLDIILVGDLRQLPPVKATPIFKQSKHYIGSQAWRSFKLHELTEVMRQSNAVFSAILTKIGDGDRLNKEEITLLESRFVTEEEANQLCPNGIRLAYSNKTVDAYNRLILENQQGQIISEAVDFISGCGGDEQLESARRALENKKLSADTGGLLQRLTFVLGQYYIITTNIAVADGLANGAMGKLVHIEQNENEEVTRVWLLFSERKSIGIKARTAARAFMLANNINSSAVPIGRHRAQGGSFDKVVYYYEKSQSQQLVYVAMSRATSIEGLYIIPVNKQKKFYHGCASNDRSCVALRDEMTKLRQNPLELLEKQLFEFVNLRYINCIIQLSELTCSCQRSYR